MTVATDLMALLAETGFELFLMSIADLTEAELIQRPVPEANHALWQLGHLVSSEAQHLSTVLAGVTPCPESFASCFSRETLKIDDASAFPSKAEIVSELKRVQAEVVAGMRQLSDADLAKPSPQPWAPTLGAFVVMMAVGHYDMHLGQIQVLRRKLGKPILF
jgi:hypothetical protein